MEHDLKNYNILQSLREYVKKRNKIRKQLNAENLQNKTWEL